MNMDLQESDQAPNSEVHDFDLNIPYVEESSLPILMNTQLASQNNIEIEIEDAVVANNGDDEVHPSPEVVTTTIIQANSGSEGGSSEHKYIASVSFAPTRISRRRRRRRRRRYGGEAKMSADPDRFCTNFYCKTRRTPMWRKGPLGPKTLCNACGLQYIKTVKGTGSVVLPAGEGDVSVPSATVEGNSSL